MNGRISRFPAWLALFALALNALWPLVSQASPRGAALVADVCTMDGPGRTVQMESEAPGSGAKLFKHCNLCVFSAERVVALAGVLGLLWQLESAAVDTPPPYAERSSPAPLLLPALARAPPGQA